MRAKRWIAGVVALCMVFVLFVNTPKRTLQVEAAETLLPLGMNNIGISGYSVLRDTGDGYVRIFTDGIKVYAENYDYSFALKSRKTITTQLSMCAGFYAGKDAYYVVFGQNNKEEDNKKETIRVVKYNKNWIQTGVANINNTTGGWANQTRYPFDGGTFDMTENAGKLYIATGHQGYVDASVGMGHQGLLMYEIDEATMGWRLMDADFWHSFSQNLTVQNANTIYLLEESEGSRATTITRYENGQSGKTITALKYGGERTSSWAISTYASANDIECSSTNILAVGTSIDQSRYGEYVPTNVYLTITPINNFTTEATQLKWMTNLKNGTNLKEVHLTKIDSNRFLLSYQDSNEVATNRDDVNDLLSESVMHYMFLDGNGNVIGQQYTANAPVSNCEPIIRNGKAVYYASDNSNVAFYTIDCQTGAFEKKIYVKAGESATWSYDNGVLTIQGSGDVGKKFSNSLSQTMRDKITKIVVKSGIQTISDNAFTGLSNLKEVVLESGVTTIGSEAFAYNHNLSRVIIPSSVSSIADNAFDTGYYWIGGGGKVYYVNIICETGSYAESYASRMNISYTTNDASGTQQSSQSTTSSVLSGSAHVQTYGDLKGVMYGDTLQMGTTGQAKRLEEITINFENNTGYAGKMQYRVHRQTYGWTDWIDAGQKAGTRGQAKRLEAIQIRLTGDLAKHYSVAYRVHAQTYGWKQGWQYDGALAGTEREAKRLECLQVKLVPKASMQTDVVYRVHRQTYGWESEYKRSGDVSGTTGQSKRLEGIEIALTGNEYSGGIVYATHVQSYGWMKSVSDGMMSGTSGQAKRLEAIKIELTGEVKEHYDIYYRVHAQTYGWLGWAKNGTEAGTAGYAKRLEAIQIVLVPKGQAAPANNYRGVISKTTTSYIKR